MKEHSQSEQITYSGCQCDGGLYSDELRSVQIDSTLDFRQIAQADKTQLDLSIQMKAVHSKLVNECIIQNISGK